MKETIKKQMWILMLILASCTSKQSVVQGQPDQVSLKQENIVFDAVKKLDQNAAEVFDLGIVASGNIIKKTFSISNITGGNLSLTFADLQAKIAATTRFSLNLATATPCGTTLKVNKSCSIELSLNNVANESYDAITTNILAGQTNPNFGTMIFSGLKSNDVSSSVVLASVLRIDRLADSVIVPANGAIIKRFYIGNVGSKTLATPTINAPASSVMTTNTCSALATLKLNGTCFFELTYTSDLTPANATHTDKITFTSNDPLVSATGLSIDLAVTNVQAVVPVVSASFNQVGLFKSTADSASTVRLYINNTGSSSLNAAAISIPLPYTVISTSCSSAVKTGKTCFFDIKLDITKTVNMSTIVSLITVGSSTSAIKAGTGATTTCSSGFSLLNNECTAIAPASEKEYLYVQTLMFSPIGDIILSESSYDSTNGHSATTPGLTGGGYPSTAVEYSVVINDVLISDCGEQLCKYDPLFGTTYVISPTIKPRYVIKGMDGYVYFRAQSDLNNKPTRGIYRLNPINNNIDRISSESDVFDDINYLAITSNNKS